MANLVFSMDEIESLSVDDLNNPSVSIKDFNFETTSFILADFSPKALASNAPCASSFKVLLYSFKYDKYIQMLKKSFNRRKDIPSMQILFVT